MRKSLESLLSANRRAFFVMGVVLCLGVFGFIAWQTKAQENPTAGSPSDSQKQTDGIRSDDKTQREPVNNDAYVIELPGKIDRASLPTDPYLATPAVGTDLGVEIEPNGTFATATNLPGTEVKIRGDVFPNADLDWFRFTAAAGDRVYAAVMTSYSSSASTDSELRIFASDGTTQLEFDQDDGSLGGLASTIAGLTIPSAGTYYAQVKHFSATNRLTPYELYLSVESGAPTPEVEANDTPATANPLPTSGWVSGARNPAVATEQDWYSFTANAGDTVYLSLDLDPERDNVQWNGRLGMALFGDANNQILVVDDASVGSVANPLSEGFFMTVKTAGTYYAFVDSATAATGGPTATYNLSVTVIPKTNVGVNCTTYTSTNVPLPIADGVLTSSTITVPATMGRIASTKVSINATHTLMADMDVNLRSPGNNNNGLFNDIGSAAVGGQTMMDLTLDQYSSGIPFVFTVVRPMILKPELNYRLDWYDGENPSGVWTLDIRDDLVNTQVGTLNGWSLEICEQPAVAGSVIYTEDFEANNGGYTLGTVGQLANEWEYGTPATLATTTANPVADIIGCNSGINCWKTDLDNTYDISSNQDLVSPNITLPNQNGTATLTWAMRYQMESATFDRARVTINEVGGMGLSRTVWQWTGATMTTSTGTPATLIGNSAGWGIYQAKIDDFANFAGRTINITFHVDTDTSINFAGVAIDDVQLRFVPAGVNADLSITKTDGVTSVNAGGTTTYTIVASNAGPDPVTGASVADTFPAALTCTYTSVAAGGATGNTAAGAGNINDVALNLPVGSSVTYTASCTISAAATGTLVNTATVSSAAIDPVPGNNSATDTDTIIPIGCQGGGNCTADLSITKTDGLTTVNPGQMITYTIVASNLGPTGVNGAIVTDNFVPAISTPAPTWTCVGAGGGTCPAGGSGNINALVNLPVNGTATFTVMATVSPTATFAFSNTARITPPVGATDPVPGNNSARDTDAVCTAPGPTTNYTSSTQTGQTIPPGGVLVAGSTADDAAVAVTLPAGWNSTVYGVPVTSLSASTNGNMTVNGAAATTFTNAALPGAVGGTNPTLFPYWDDFDMDPADTIGGGIYTNTIGVAPNRQFYVEWRATHFSDTTTAINTNVAILLTEGTDEVRYIYALTGINTQLNGLSSTVGIQRQSTGAQNTQFSFNTASLSAGLQITYIRSGCPTTAAGVSVSGRVLTPDGYGLRNAIVSITDSTGMTRTARTTSFGYYTFENVEVGGTYVVSVGSKSYTFTPRTITVNDSVSDLDLVADGPSQ